MTGFDGFSDRITDDRTGDQRDPREAYASPTGDIRHGVSQIARDVVILAELQAELLQVDLRNWVTTSIVPALIAGSVALVSAAASLPLLLLSFAYFLVEYANLTVASSMLAAAGAGILIATIGGLLAMAAVRRSKGAFTRFRVELARNIRWLKQVLSRPAPAREPTTSEASYETARRSPR